MEFNATLVIMAAGMGSRFGGLKPSLVVLVATIRALKYNGGVTKDKLAEENLDKALILQIDYTIKSVLSKGGLLHTNTVDTRNYYLEKIR